MEKKCWYSEIREMFIKICELLSVIIQVSMFRPAAKAGLSAGNIILIINDWQIEAMDKPEVRGGARGVHKKLVRGVHFKKR
mgnify:FL=1